MKSFYFPQLTGLRGAAVLLVFASHAADLGMAPVWLSDGYGKIGVMLFFVLSSYLMSRIYIHRDFSDGCLDYFLARAARIVPLYFSIVAISIVATHYTTGWRYNISGAKEILEHFLFVKAGYELWAVPVEVQFYLVFALIWMLCEKLSLATDSVKLFFLLFSIWLPFFGVAAVVRPDFNTIGHSIHFFLIGVYIAVWNDKLMRIPSSTLDRLGVLAAISIAFLCNPYFRKETSTYISIWIDPIIIISICLFFVSVLRGGHMSKLMTVDAIHFMGKISFGFYLLHSPILYLVAQLHWIEGGGAKLVIAFLVTFVFAVVSYFFLERPASKAIRRMTASKYTLDASRKKA